MNFALSEIELPVRIIPSSPLSDDQLMRFCAANETLRVEREPNGEILIMTPSGFQTSRINQRICRFLDEWAESDGRGGCSAMGWRGDLWLLPFTARIA
jgi:Uma2 family endonuclease